MIVTVVDLKEFTNKNKSITYIKTFLELYNRRNHEQFYKIYGIVEFEKMCTLRVKYFYNLDAYCIVKISSILHYTHVVFKK